RRNRQQMLGLEGDETSRFGGRYADLDHVREELRYARRLFARHGWPEIDVTKRSVEETAATIYQLVQARAFPEIGALVETGRAAESGAESGQVESAARSSDA
ncbi:MAG: kinase/pyrophosphorylase, partial [Geminicoccaceae bacterium]|nr:kinase/pyrophosphorylase [Geminicoccaceae bacterium]